MLPLGFLLSHNISQLQFALTGAVPSVDEKQSLLLAQQSLLV